MASYKPTQWTRQTAPARLEGTSRARHDAVQRVPQQTIVTPAQATYEPLFQRLGTGANFDTTTMTSSGYTIFQPIVLPQGVDIHQVGVRMITVPQAAGSYVRIGFWHVHETGLYPSGPPEASSELINIQQVDGGSWFKFGDINCGLGPGVWWVGVSVICTSTVIGPIIACWNPVHSVLAADAVGLGAPLGASSAVGWDTLSVLAYQNSTITTQPTITDISQMMFTDGLAPIVFASMRPLT